MEARVATLSHDDYTVGWICALPVETAAARLMLEEIHRPLPHPLTDQNTYILGNIGGHNIVIASLPGGAYGNTSATTVATHLLSTFRSIRFGFMVGIGGGVPSRTADIRLGDIVVSQPTETSGGVIQFDLGKTLTGNRFHRTGMLNRPPTILLTALTALRGCHIVEGSRISELLSSMQVSAEYENTKRFIRPTHEDCLFQADYDHHDVASDTCMNCDRSKLCLRPPRAHQEPIIHYGLIGSANQVLKDGRRRDQLAQDLGIYCVEMEAAGLMNDFPCLVVRGICDYADSHKNKEWQGYAAAAAAAYTKELLLMVPVDQKQYTCTSSSMHPDNGFKVPLDLSAIPLIENFIGRQDELGRLWQYLRPTNSPSRRVAIVHGLGGMGKTQLATRFARDHKHDFTAIFWLNGKDRGTLMQSLSSILPRLPGQLPNLSETIKDVDVKQRVRDVLLWLATEGNSRWLIIFDNIDQYTSANRSDSDGDGHGYDIAEFFPTADHGSILITSRLGKLVELGGSFPIHRLDPTDTIHLLLQSSHLAETDTSEELERHPDTLALVTRLDGLPLAIVIAGAFMRETGTSVTEYLQFYQESWSDLQMESSPDRQYQQGNILQTWMISYREILNRDPTAAQLLLLFAHFDSRDIWYELVKNGRNSSHIPGWFKRAISSGLSFKRTVKILIEFSLLETKKQGGSYTIHPVVQDWCIHIARTDQNVDATMLEELVLFSVGFSVPEKGGRDYAELLRRLIPHTNRIEYEGWSYENIGVCEAYHKLGDLYYDQGNIEKAGVIYQRVLVGYEKSGLGPDHTDTIHMLKNHLAVVYFQQGRPMEAEKMFQQALAGFEKAEGPDHIETFKIWNNLGILYRMQGNLKKAEEIYERGISGYEKALGPDHFYTLTLVSNLGSVYRYQNRRTDAEDLYRRVLTVREKTLGLNHPSTLEAVNNFGCLYYEQGDLENAEKMFQQALSGFEKALGLDNAAIHSAASGLLEVYADQRKAKEAEDLYRRIQFCYKKAFGAHHQKSQQLAEKLHALNITDEI